MDNQPNVVIVGAGFAGLEAAKALRKDAVDLCIIDRRNFHLFQPLLYQVATAGLNPADIAHPIRAVFRDQENVRSVILASVESIDLETRAVVLDDGRRVDFDYLLLATGARHSYFGNEAWEEYAPGLKTVEDALEIRRRVLSAFERAERFPSRADAELTFVVVGGGPTGVELAGAMVEIAVNSLSGEFDHIEPARARVVLAEGEDRVLGAYPEELSTRAREQLEELGVEVRLGRMVTKVDEAGVELDDGERIDAGTVLWAAGVQASGLGRKLGVDCDRTGRVKVEPDLSIPGHAGVFVAGDLASMEIGGAAVPGVAPAAMQAGRHVARQIRNDLAGRPREDFRYRDKGSLATIGRARAIADLGRLKFSGFAAWAAWLFVHVFFLIGFRNRIAVLSQWAWNYITFRRGARIITSVARTKED